MIKGIGPVYAKKMVDKFGEEVLTVIEKSSAQLEEIGGIGTWQSHRFLAEQSDWLRDHIAIAGGVRSV